MNNATAATRIGIVGCGNIFDRYMIGLREYPHLQVVACADLDRDRALEAAGRYMIDSEDPASLIARADIDIVVNLTPPAAHHAVLRQAIDAGKHVYVEKPITTTVAQARPLLAAAAAQGVLVGAAADTFLGSAGQTARHAVDRGDIGEVLAATAFITHSRAETWHPNPGFLFQPGGGPLLDLGPYYLAALINLLGPVGEVSGATRIGATRRPVSAPGRLVDHVDVTVPTHASATLRFAGGAIGSLTASFDIWDHHLPFIEVYGTEGTLSLPDPNLYDGPVTVRGHGESAWRELERVIPNRHGPDFQQQLLRGTGVADLADALHGSPLHVTGELALHVLDVLESIQTSSDTHTTVTVASSCPRPAPVATTTPEPATTEYSA